MVSLISTMTKQANGWELEKSNPNTHQEGGKKFAENVCSLVSINTKRRVDICRS